ncbi:MAG: hypothetical protein GQ570_06430 [Helicobacteraceae bacterium]|nr:hypothetical protein [Helicobacteraceae bacterium]
MTEAIEKESESVNLTLKESTNIFTIFIELSQNMMNYTKKIEIDGKEFDPKGIIILGKKPDGKYYILSKNVVSLEDRQKLEPKLQGIVDTDIAGVKKLYKEARKSGKDTHNKGGGIGFYEIAKRCSTIDYDFKALSEDRFYFRFEATL